MALWMSYIATKKEHSRCNWEVLYLERNNKRKRYARQTYIYPQKIFAHVTVKGAGPNGRAV